jgi:hypothetical protein
MIVLNVIDIRCDGCGQIASPEHIARRLRRLEWATRYRPVHIQTLLLGAFSPREDGDCLYSPGGEFRGEAALLLRAIGMATEGRPAEAVHAEFQAAGLFLAHVLECPLENSLAATSNAARLLREHLPSVASRIRRSLKPKRVMLVTELLRPIVEDIVSLDLGCPVILNDGMPFALDSAASEAQISRFREMLLAQGRP